MCDSHQTVSYFSDVWQINVDKFIKLRMHFYKLINTNAVYLYAHVKHY